jgi:hypothetical protein
VEDAPEALKRDWMLITKTATTSATCNQVCISKSATTSAKFIAMMRARTNPVPPLIPAAEAILEDRSPG